MKLLKRIGSIAAVALLVIGCSSGTREVKPDAPMVASVNGAGIYKIDMEEALQQLVPSAIFHGGMTPERRAKYWSGALDLTIERELLYQEAARIGLKADEDQIGEIKRKIIDKFGSRSAFKDALKSASLTEDEYEHMLAKKMLAEELIKVEVDDKSVPSDEELLEHFNAHKDSYNKPLTRRIRHILVRIDPAATSEEVEARRKKAEEALSALKSGADFYDVAMSYSEEPYAVKGGDLGELHKGRLVAEVDKEAWSLKIGQTSGIIRSMYGFHIIRVDSESEPTEAVFEEVKDKARSFIQNKRKNELREALMGRLKADAKIEIFQAESDD